MSFLCLFVTFPLTDIQQASVYPSSSFYFASKTQLNFYWVPLLALGSFFLELAPNFFHFWSLYFLMKTARSSLDYFNSASSSLFFLTENLTLVCDRFLATKKNWCGFNRVLVTTMLLSEVFNFLDYSPVFLSQNSSKLLSTLQRSVSCLKDPISNCVFFGSFPLR